MNLVTIPKKISGGKDDLVVILREEYDALRARAAVREFTPTKGEIKALRAAEKRLARGEVHTIADVKRDLAARR